MLVAFTADGTSASPLRAYSFTAAATSWYRSDTCSSQCQTTRLFKAKEQRTHLALDIVEQHVLEEHDGVVTADGLRHVCKGTMCALRV